METTFWLPLVVTLLIFGIGLILTIVPVFPGPVIVFSGVVLFHFWAGLDAPGTTYLWITFGMVLLSLGLDMVLSLVGARRYGATWKGGVGAIMGGFVGIFIPPPLLWILIGPMVGAVLAEILTGRQWGEASRAGWGTFLGTILAMGAKMAVSIFIIMGFFYLLWAGRST